MIKKKSSMVVLVILVAFMATALLFSGLIRAGSDTPPCDPPCPTMHTLDEIYHKVEHLSSYLVPKTDQTESYETGDDGDLRKGVTWPTPRFTDNGDGTVTDNLTGLIWLKNANCDGVKIWADALTYFNTLASGVCGLSDSSVAGDWRMPNLFELESLRDMAYSTPCISNAVGTDKWTTGDPFTGVQSTYYWSSTTREISTTNAWRVAMSYGFVIDGNKTLYNYVWPVRDGN
jgi:hypothetical protein